MPEPLTPPNDPFEFAPYALRLGGREWWIVIGIVGLFACFAPRWWMKIEPLEEADDYRVPYALSADYALYERHLRESAQQDKDAVFVIGDSVVWGEYVSREGTLSHALRAATGDSRHFINAGVNGLFPLALEGLVRDFGRPVNGRKVLLQANLLWMSSPEADLSTGKERKFNHEALVPQFSVRVPCYRATIDQRLGYLAGRNIDVLAWSRHLQICYFDQLGIPEWTLEPANTRRNPLAAITRVLPTEPADDPERGEASPRHRAWFDAGRKPLRFDWVAPDKSLQLAAFKRLVELLRSRGNDVLVVVGPFNEHMIAEGSRTGFDALRGHLDRWLEEEGVRAVAPEVLRSELYGDASHPLTAGYQRVAEQLIQAGEFQEWLGQP
jgi:hypothetical protein